MIILGVVLRLICANTIGQTVTKYAHFNSPMMDVREVREILYNYEKTGEFFLGPNSIAQSEVYLLMIYNVRKVLAEMGSEGFVLISAFFEVLSISFQIVIFYLVYSATDKKTDSTWGALLWIIFNPI